MVGLNERVLRDNVEDARKGLPSNPVVYEALQSLQYHAGMVDGLIMSGLNDGDIRRVFTDYLVKSERLTHVYGDDPTIQDLSDLMKLYSSSGTYPFQRQSDRTENLLNAAYDGLKNSDHRQKA